MVELKTEKRKEYMKQYYQNHKEQSQQYARGYYLLHKEECQARNRTYYSKWFKDDLIPLYASRHGDRNGFVEGVVFTHPDGRMAKLRRDMFDWFEGRRH